jgi:uncharacterized membrane protein YgdD (TMEM256/DUF423 family)
MGPEVTQVKIFLILGSVSAFIAVGLGAFAAHLLKDRLPADLFAIFEVGVRYHLYHALALIAVAWACQTYPGSSAALAGWLFVAGTAVFCGSLYALSLTGARWLGAVTPLGGLCFLAGWLWLAWSVWREG